MFSEGILIRGFGPKERAKSLRSLKQAFLHKVGWSRGTFSEVDFHQRQGVAQTHAALEAGIGNCTPDAMDRLRIEMNAVRHVFVGEDHPSASSKRIDQHATCRMSTGGSVQRASAG